MADFKYKTNLTFVTILLAFAAFATASITHVAPSDATAIGDTKPAVPVTSEDHGGEEFSKPALPLSADQRKNGAETIFDSFPDDAIEEFLAQDNKYIDKTNAMSAIATSITDVAQIPDFADALTALEWVRRWADSGYWLEIDQWADFKAVAIAGYSPEIQYWLGRDSWAPFNSSGATDLPDSPALQTPDQQHLATSVYVSETATKNNPASTFKRSETYVAKHDGSTMTIRTLAISMVRKMAEQPIFYIIIFGCGLIMLLWSIGKQART